MYRSTCSPDGITFTFRVQFTWQYFKGRNSRSMSVPDCRKIFYNRKKKYLWIFCCKKHTLSKSLVELRNAIQLMLTYVSLFSIFNSRHSCISRFPHLPLRFDLNSLHSSQSRRHSWRCFISVNKSLKITLRYIISPKRERVEISRHGSSPRSLTILSQRILNFRPVVISLFSHSYRSFEQANVNINIKYCKSI